MNYGDTLPDLCFSVIKLSLLSGDVSVLSWLQLE